jgi:hypothetical protein
VREDGDYAVSVRAPRAAPLGADAFCAGSAATGAKPPPGIARLARADLDSFLAHLGAAYPGA